MINQSSKIDQGSPKMRSIEIEQAAHALRQRLAIATSHHIQSPHALTVQFLKENAFAASSGSADTSGCSSLSPSTAHTSVSGDHDTVGVRGLGIDTEEGDGDVNLHLYDVTARSNVNTSSAHTPATTLRRSNAKGSQPSLYDAIFGPSFGRMALPGNNVQSVAMSATSRKRDTDTKATSSSMTASPVFSVEQKRSPHVRQGSSAFLEQVALSPHMTSPHHLFPSPRQYTAERDLYKDILHDTPTMSMYHSPSQSWSSTTGVQNSAQLTPQFIFGSSRRQSRSGTHTTDAAQATTHALHYGHKRMHSLGGSVLPNGHPASSLAQDLGLASGGVGRTPRSRNSSATGGVASNGRSTVRADQETMAGFLLANLALSPSSSQSEKKNNANSGSTPGRTSTSAFVDPNFATPRRRQRTSIGDVFTPPCARQHAQDPPIRRCTPRSPNQLDVIDEGHASADGSSNEAAAHMLLDLAASPSPLRESSRARFPGHTPSLREDLLPMRRSSTGLPSALAEHGTIQYRLMDDIERHEAHSSNNSGAGQSASYRGHARTRSADNPRSHPNTPPSVLRGGQSTRTPSQIGRVRLMSPPITPPDSDEVRASYKTEQGDRVGLHRSSSPVSPSRRRTPQEERNMLKPKSSLQAASTGENALPITPVHEVHDPLSRHEDGDASQSKQPLETPRTPPPKASTPRTPKAPGSNFSYGDFLHVSPSPQPRIRSENGFNQLPSTETPTRATRSRARFLDFGQVAGQGQETGPMAAAAGYDDGNGGPLSDDDCTFTVGRLPPQRVAGSITGLGLGDALELHEPSGVQASSAAEATAQYGVNNAESPHVLVPSKRSAKVLQSKPSTTPKRHRAAASS